MTESIFDPMSGETERSGSTFTPPDAEQISHMPPEVIDGRVETDDEEDPETDDQPQDVEVEPGLGAAAAQQRQVDLEASDSRRFQSQGEAKEEVAEPFDGDEPQ